MLSLLHDVKANTTGRTTVNTPLVFMVSFNLQQRNDVVYDAV